MAKYLLGQLSEQEEADLESQYLADDSSFDELLAIEDDLRDAYVREELSRVDREAFEQRLLSAPPQLRKQEFARALRQYLMESGMPTSPRSYVVSTWKSLLRVLRAQPRGILIPVASAGLAILMVGSWWLGRRSVQPLQSRNAPGVVAPTAGPLPNQVPQVQTQTSPEAQEPETRTIAVVLSRGLVRSTEQESRPVVIPPDVSRVQLEARFEGDYPRYQAVLQTAEGKKIWSKGDLEAQAFPGGKRILLYLLSSLLPPGDYILTLRGLPSAGSPETVAEYAFRVKKN